MCCACFSVVALFVLCLFFVISGYHSLLIADSLVCICSFKYSFVLDFCLLNACLCLFCYPFVFLFVFGSLSAFMCSFLFVVLLFLL